MSTLQGTPGQPGVRDNTISVTRILVTGGAGFIGSHLVEHLLKTTAFEVVVLDRLDETSTLHRLGDTDAYREHRSRVTVVWHDLRAPLSAYVAHRIGEVDIVFHLAASTHVDRSIVDPLSFAQDNVIGTINLMQWARRQKFLDRFVYFSTDEVFGPAASVPAGVVATDLAHRGHTGAPFDTYRSWDRYRSSNPYSASKAAAEEFALAYHNTYGLPIVITHCVNAFGERQHPEKYLPLLIRRILAHETIFIHANETKDVAATRWYVHARNIAAALAWLVDPNRHRRPDGSWTSDPRPQPGAKVNLGGQVELAADVLAERVGVILDTAPKLQRVAFHASRPGHDMRYALTDDLERNGFNYPVAFDDSLRRTVLWYRDNPQWLTGGDA